MDKAICNIPDAEDKRFKSWAKLVTSVDCDKTTGYAFRGEWVKRGQLQELPVGGVLLLYDETGSVKNHTPWVRVHLVNPVGLDEQPYFRVGGWDWALKLRDDVDQLLTMLENKLVGLGEERTLEGFVVVERRPGPDEGGTEFFTERSRADEALGCVDEGIRSDYVVVPATLTIHKEG